MAPPIDPKAYRRRRLVVLGGLTLGCVLAVAIVALVADDGEGQVEAAGGEATSTGAEATDADGAKPESTTGLSPTAPPTTTPIPASRRSLVEVGTITGDLTPKSVVASGRGLFTAQNMMYTHTVTVNDRNMAEVATISDEITPADWGFDFDPGVTLQGAPVEASFSPDGAHVYVSNYHMYGPGYGPEPGDGCPQMTTDHSFVYRIDMSSFAIDQVIQVGTVPKYLAGSPDGSCVVVSNWCSYDLSIIDTGAGSEIARVPAGRYPRGIVFAPSGDTAYVAVMGGDTILELDMASNTVTNSFALAGRPRHLNISPDGALLYATLNRVGDVVKIDLASRTVTSRVATGAAPRSMTLSDDGEALYVVNYKSDTVSKVLTSTFEEVQELPVAHHPIGITYDDDTERVWVASYGGVLTVFEDQPIEDEL